MLVVKYPPPQKGNSNSPSDQILEEKPSVNKNRIVEESPAKQEKPEKKSEKIEKDDTSGDIKHQSFDDFLDTNFGHIIRPKERSGSEVPIESRAFLKEFSYSYKINRDCKNHDPYPLAMCSACIPPSIHMKRQVYRHVDYAQIMNSEEVGQLIQHWFKTSMQRVGYLFGYYAEDPTYEQGVRAIVEAIYEPPQQNDLNSSIILPDQLEINVNKIAEKLGMQRIGYIFTTYNNDVFLTAEEVTYP
jgi:nuclear protein localization family protein 4